MVIVFKVIYRFNAIPVKVPNGIIFSEIDKLILKFMWKCKGPKIAKAILKKNKVRRLVLNFKTYHNFTVIKTQWYWHENKHIDQWNRIKSSEIHSYIYGLLISVKGARTIQWGKMSLFNKWFWDSWITTLKRMKLDPLSHATYKN